MEKVESLVLRKKTNPMSPLCIEDTFVLHPVWGSTPETPRVFRSPRESYPVAQSSSSGWSMRSQGIWLCLKSSSRSRARRGFRQSNIYETGRRGCSAYYKGPNYSATCYGKRASTKYGR